MVRMEYLEAQANFASEQIKGALENAHKQLGFEFKINPSDCSVILPEGKMFSEFDETETKIIETLTPNLKNWTDRGGKIPQEYL